MEFLDIDGLGIGSIPFQSIDLPADIHKDILKILPLLKPVWYEIDGKKILEVRDDAGKVVGYKAYILFVEGR